MGDRVSRISKAKISETNKLGTFFDLHWARLKTIDSVPFFNSTTLIEVKKKPTHVQIVRRSITLWNENLIWIQIRRFSFPLQIHCNLKKFSVTIWFRRNSKSPLWKWRVCVMKDVRWKQCLITTTGGLSRSVSGWNDLISL